MSDTFIRLREKIGITVSYKHFKFVMGNLTFGFPPRGALCARRRGGDSEGRSEEGDNPPALHQPDAAQQAG